MRIAVFSTDPVIGEALSCLLVTMGGLEVVSCSSNLSSVASIMESQKPDLLLMTEEFSDHASCLKLKSLKGRSHVRTMLLHADDTQAPGVMEAYDRVQSRWPGVSALLDALRSLSGHSIPISQRVTQKSESDEAPSFHTQKRLTIRERETAELVSRGMTNAQIASRLGISEPTVKIFVSKLLRTYDCENRVQLALQLSKPFQLEKKASRKETTKKRGS